MTAPLQLIGLTFPLDAGAESRLLAEAASERIQEAAAADPVGALGVHSRAEAVSRARTLGLLVWRRLLPPGGKR
jgi:hypothetical protein